MQCPTGADNLAGMHTATPTDDRLTVRLGSQAKPLRQAAQKSLRSESELTRAALALFLARHKTAAEINAAIIAAEKESA